MKYRVEETDEVFDSIDDVIDYCIDPDYHWDDDYFPEWVDNCENSVCINGERYYPYQILENCDTDNLDNLHRTYCDECNEDDESQARRDLERAENRDRVEIQGYVVMVFEDDECTGDFDGDDTLEYLREKLQCEIELANSTKEEEKKNEKDLMDMFQIVGE